MTSNKSEKGISSIVDSNELKQFEDLVKDKFNNIITPSIKNKIKEKYSDYKVLKTANLTLKKSSLLLESLGFISLVSYLIYKGPIQKKLSIGIKRSVTIPLMVFIPGHFIIQSYINSNFRSKLYSLVKGDIKNLS